MCQELKVATLSLYTSQRRCPQLMNQSFPIASKSPSWVSYCLQLIILLPRRRSCFTGSRWNRCAIKDLQLKVLLGTSWDIVFVGFFWAGVGKFLELRNFTCHRDLYYELVLVYEVYVFDCKLFGGLLSFWRKEVWFVMIGPRYISTRLWPGPIYTSDERYSVIKGLIWGLKYR